MARDNTVQSRDYKLIEDKAGFRLYLFEVIGSTNDFAISLAEAGKIDRPVAVTTKSQDKGRGRSGRQWSDQRGNLFLSMVMPELLEPQIACQSAFVAAVAVCDTFCEIAPHIRNHLHLKWPNDILLREDKDGHVETAKLGGILIESASQISDGSDVTSWLVTGIGLNIAIAPAIADRRTACLNDIMAAPADLDDVRITLMQAYRRRWQQWLTIGFAPIRDAWLEFGHKIGDRISIRDSEQGMVTGHFAGLDKDGVLLFKPAKGAMRRINAGEIFLPQSPTP